MAVPNLAGLALEAAGGLDRWRTVRSVRCWLSMRGPLWDQVGQPTLLDGIEVEVELREQRTIFTCIAGPATHGVYTPHRVVIEDPDGTVLQERDRPRKSFPSRDEGSRWDQLHALYFGGYGMWNYLSTPYLLTRPGMTTEELTPAQVSGGPWRRLQVSFPDDVVTHSSPQVWYYDESGRQRRLDYAPEVMGNRRAAHLTEAHRTVAGLVVPTHRYVLPRFDDGRLGAEPFIIVDLSDITVEFDDESGPR